MNTTETRTSLESDSKETDSASWSSSRHREDKRSVTGTGTGTETDCASLVKEYTEPDEDKDKYLDLLLTKEAQDKISRKIDTYYQLKSNALKRTSNGVAVCIWCNQAFENKQGSTNDQFQSFYDPKTFCKTLKIVCPVSPPCRSAEKEWTLTYGVVFNLEEMVRRHQKKIEELKHEIILNKNDLMFGYKDREDALAYHDTKLAELKGIMDTYATRLYNYLSYANNHKRQEDLDHLNQQIRTLVQEITAFVKNDNLQEAVTASLQIKKESVCVRELKQLQANAFQEYLFNCESQFVLDEDKELGEKVKRSKEKHVLERTRREKEKEHETLKGEHSKEEKKEKRKQKIQASIEKELNHLYDSYEMFDELLKDDADHYETTQSEIDKLARLLKTYGTEEQKKEFSDIRQQFVDKFQAIEHAKMEKENAEKEKIETMLQQGENDDVLKKEMEQDMEELV